MEPEVEISISPILFDGINGAGGNKVAIRGYDEEITEIYFKESINSHFVRLTTVSGKVILPNSIIINNIKIHRNIIEDENSYAVIDITINNEDVYKNSPYKAKSPIENRFIDLFQEFFIVTIKVNDEYYFTGMINNTPKAIESARGLSIQVVVGSLMYRLARSGAIQTAEDQKGLVTIVQQQYKLGDLINKLLQETVIRNALYKIKYFKSPNEDKQGGGGLAISKDSLIWAMASPDITKLGLIRNMIYPFQRVMYVSGDGSFIITPLQFYYDSNEYWNFTPNEPLDNGILIRWEDIKVQKRTGDTINRVQVSLLPIFVTFQQSDTAGTRGKKIPAWSVATPTSESFKKLRQLALGGNLQTEQKNVDVSQQFLTGSYLFNVLFKVVSGFNGLVNNSVAINGNDDITYNPRDGSKGFKFYANMMAGQRMAEHLFSETLISIPIPFNLIYNTEVRGFRKLPLNQIIKLPPSNNRLMDAGEDYFCYGFDFDYKNNGSTLTLHVTKPYTHTLFWADEECQET